MTQKATPSTPLPDNQDFLPERSPRKDHRAAVQSHKLRMDLLEKGIRFGHGEPAMKPRSPRVLLGSAILGAVGIVGTIGASALIQFFTR